MQCCCLILLNKQHTGATKCQLYGTEVVTTLNPQSLIKKRRLCSLHKIQN